MTPAASAHRVLDRDYARALGEPGGTALVGSRDRGRDARSLDRPQPKVLLTTLSVRTSSRGNQYLSGYLGRSSVVAFAGEADKFGNATWDVYLCERPPRLEAATSAAVTAPVAT